MAQIRMTGGAPEGKPRKFRASGSFFALALADLHNVVIRLEHALNPSGALTKHMDTMTKAEKELGSICNGQSLRMAARYVTAFYDKTLAPSGLRLTQFMILYKVRQVGPIDVKPLAAVMAMDRTTLAATLKPLERDGLLRLAVNPQDRRARRIEITQEGSMRLDLCVPLWREAQARFEERYGAPKAADMRDLMKDVLATGLEPWAE